MQRVVVLPANVAGEVEEAGERGKGETQHDKRSKEANKQETTRTKLGEGTVT